MLARKATGHISLTKMVEAYIGETVGTHTIIKKAHMHSQSYYSLAPG